MVFHLMFSHSGLEWPLGGGVRDGKFCLSKVLSNVAKNLENHKRIHCFRIPKDWKLGFYESQIASENGVREVWKNL